MKYSEIKKLPCVFCGSSPIPIRGMKTPYGGKVVTLVRCENLGCITPKMTPKDWALRAKYYENKESPKQGAKTPSPVGMKSREYSRAGGMICMLSKINHTNERRVVKDKKTSGPKNIPDWVYLAIRWAKEYGGVSMKEMSRVYGGSVAGICYYNIRVDLEPSPDNKKDWERLKRDGRPVDHVG